MPEVLSVNYEFSDEAIAAMRERAKEVTALWLLEWYGDNCPDFCEKCVRCRRWKLFRDLFAE